jgi:glycosyltransferase involved in cell wall biosynthesis
MLYAESVRICLLAGTFPAVSETFIWEPVRWLGESGSEVCVIADHEGVLPAGASELDRPPVVAVQRLSPGNRFGALAAAPLTAFRKLPAALRWPKRGSFDSLSRAALLSHARADVLLAHFGPEGVKWLAGAALARLPLSVFFHGVDATELLSRAPHAYDELFTSGVGLITNGAFLKSRLVAAGAPAESVTVVPYGANPKLAESRAEPAREPRRLLTIARLVAKKGVADALRAFATIEKTLSEPWVFEIIGDGPLRAELGELVTALGIADKVHFRGACAREVVFDALEKASIFVLASKASPSGDSEGTPVAIIEAATLGRAIVSTRHAGIPELLPADTANEGYLVPEGDVPALAEALGRLAADPTRIERWGLACATFARARHSASAHVAGLLAALETKARVPSRVS